MQDYYGDTNVTHIGGIDAEILVVVDCPDRSGVTAKMPIGNDAWVWTQKAIQRAGITAAVRVEALHPKYIVGNDISKKLTTNEILCNISELNTRILSYPNVKVIVPMGEYSAFAVLGKGRVIREVMLAMGGVLKEDDTPITTMRGGVWNIGGRLVIPMIHPFFASVNRKWIRRMLNDWRKVGDFMQEGDSFFPSEPSHIINPTYPELTGYLTRAFSDPYAPMALDIETWGNRLSCVGFAMDAGTSIVIPTDTADRLHENLPFIQALCEGDHPKILANGNFDWYWLSRGYGIEINNFCWDVQLLHHCVHPNDNHGLEYLTSIYLRRPSWKSMAKGEYDAITLRERAEKLWVYNGIDCCNTRELLDHLRAEVESEGQLDFYFRHYAKMIEPLAKMSQYGVLADVSRQDECLELLNEECRQIQRNIIKQAGGFNLFGSTFKTESRKPTANEWKSLIIKDKWDGTYPPKAKAVNREAVAEMKAAGLVYRIGGKKAGTIEYKVEVLGNGFSGQKMQEYFYEKLGIPKQYKRVKGQAKPAVTIGKSAQVKILQMYPKVVGSIMPLILAYSEKVKEAAYFKGAWDADNRIRCHYGMLTSAARLSSKSNPMGTGYNLQNIKR